MKNSYDTYVETVLQSVLDEKRHQEIKDELMDHLQSREEELSEDELDPSEIEFQVLQDMGSPEELGKNLNRIYGMNQKPLWAIGISSSLLAVFNGYLMIHAGMSNLSQVVMVALGLIVNLMCIYVVVKTKKNLDKVREERIYFSGDIKTYIKKLTDKILIRGFCFLVVLMIVLGLFDYFMDDFENNLLIIGFFYASYLFFSILNSYYPKMIFSETGVYIMHDLPTFKSWEEVEGYEWQQKLSNYQLRLKNKRWFSKIHIGFNSKEKDLVDDFYKKHQKSEHPKTLQ
ncbi:permease prefix domain 1-containing protein [Acetobacterium woodii]|uniref:DUF5673 domain-containing protein n=1 Tax=Acetobacterium woodii (strain ATCC 29683 / DSM 1030 / JCM 2381 / KCTC 1655 / WB1) TaxID=931626 RepID=H6LGQ1_ACEWD|nr:permease prefix domain 1-containing protein [Acetobacterium woodii]AFA48379.1 hypothetical protein Awo_c15970 [Acetobacterium woodii DSM 1030]